MSPEEDRAALVTGAARGIGAATVMALAANGWRVVAVDGCADDPDLPYPMGSRAELDAVVKAAQAAAPAGGGPAAGGGPGAADPALPYPMGSRAELDAVVKAAQAAAPAGDGRTAGGGPAGDGERA